jgi:chromosome segregation ATPase
MAAIRRSTSVASRKSAFGEAEKELKVLKQQAKEAKAHTRLLKAQLKASRKASKRARKSARAASRKLEVLRAALRPRRPERVAVRPAIATVPVQRPKAKRKRIVLRMLPVPAPLVPTSPPTDSGPQEPAPVGASDAEASD